MSVSSVPGARAANDEPRDDDKVDQNVGAMTWTLHASPRS
jgi:hypothetical protein